MPCRNIFSNNINETFTDGNTITKIKVKSAFGVSNDPNDFYKALNNTCDQKKDYSKWKGFTGWKSSKNDEPSYKSQYAESSVDAKHTEQHRYTFGETSGYMLNHGEISGIEKALKSSTNSQEQRKILQDALKKLEDSKSKI